MSKNDYCLVISGITLAELLKFQLYYFDAIAFIGLQYGLERLGNFVLNVSTVFEKIEKGNDWLFLGQFWLCFSDPSHTVLMSLHTYRSLKWCIMAVEKSFES